MKTLSRLLSIAAFAALALATAHCRRSKEEPAATSESSSRESSLMRRTGGDRPFLRIAGRTYDCSEYERLGINSFKLAGNFMRTGDIDMYQFVFGLTGGAANTNDASEKFFIGRIIIREAKKEFGVHPAKDEISDYIRSMRAFADKDGHFDKESYDNVKKDHMGALGLTEGDLLDLISDMLAVKQIKAVIGPGKKVDRDKVTEEIALKNQAIDGEIACLGIDSFKTEIRPTDEQIKSYWQERQDSFMTDELRKFTYFIAAPVMPAADQPEPPETIADAAASDEVKMATAKKREEEQRRREAELAEVRRQKQIELDGLVDDFCTALDDGKDTNFEDLAKANHWELKTTGLFPHSKPPADLELKLRSSGRGGKVADQLFRMQLTADPLSKFSQPLACGENQWLVARLDSTEKSRPQTYQEAKDEARSQLICQSALQTMKTTANGAVTKIKTGLASGKSFADAAKDAGISEVKPFTKVTSAYRPDPGGEPKTIYQAACGVAPGALADIITEEDRIFIVHVTKRVALKLEDAAARLDEAVKAQVMQNESIAFTDWITARTEATKVERLYRR